MTYVPHTEPERAEMLAAIGIDRTDALFDVVPEHVRFPKLALPPPCAEIEIEREMQELAGRNFGVDPAASFLGAGTYHHYRPATVDNASHYDGATALAEAVLLALNAGQGKRSKIVLSPAVHPQYRAVVKTYLRGTHAATVAGDEGGADIDQLKSQLDDTTAALVIQNPNFFGQFEPVEGLAALVHGTGALLIVVADPIALGRFRPPGASGADIVVADGQCLGIPPSFGGPHLGIITTHMAHVRRLSGHIVGETVDVDGRRGYVLTLATREQHIRRAKATSNICTNSTVCALAAAAYLATMGKAGLRQVAELCFHNSHYAAGKIGALDGFSVNPQAPGKPFFKEFVVRMPRPVAEVNRRLREQFGIIGGYDLGADYPHLQQHILMAVTELHSRAAIDRLIAALAQIAK
jgi:glycine dehydrogenase subunit 1